MAEAPPKLGDIPQQSDFHVPTLGSEAHTAPAPAPIESETAPSTNSGFASSVGSAKDTVFTSKLHPQQTHAMPSNHSLPDSQAAYSAVANHPTTQAAKDTVVNGPVADSVRNQTAKTGNDLQGLANSRTVPDSSTQNGQPLTHYHSFFYSLLSWEHPRATAISFATTIAFIFATRYLPLLRWFFKASYLILGVTAAAEIAGRLTISQGLASSFRPRRYYTIPRESLEAILEDVEQLINFFVIEFQRVIFAENVTATAGAFVAAFLSYWLIKWLPLWGLSLIGASVVYLGPFVYLNNKELIDGQLAQAQNIVNSQAHQVRDLAAQHTGQATSTLKQYAGDYSAKAQGYLHSRGGASSPSAVKSEPDFPAVPKGETTSFPAAPQHEPVADVKPEVNGSEPLASY